jgi:hypothetical protein
MKNPSDELIWQGRIHLGDEPGVYGDASYSGLAAEFPITVWPFPGGMGEDLTFILEAEDVHVFSGYPGHAVSIFGYQPDPSGIWKQVTLVSSTLSTNTLEMKSVSLKGHKFISVQVRVDTSVAPGLYNDFVWIRLSLRSKTHYAVLGFEE